MPFLRNIQFTQLIKIEGHLKEFNFRKSNANAEATFTIDTADHSGNRISFNMQQVSNEWKMVQQALPSWIIDNESCLNEMIRKELAVQEIYFTVPVSGTYRQFNRLFNIFGTS